MSTILVSEHSQLGLATTAYSDAGFAMTRRYFVNSSVYSFDCTPLLSTFRFEPQRPIVNAASKYLFAEWVGAHSGGDDSHLDVSLISYVHIPISTKRPTDVLDIPVAAFYGSDRTVVFGYVVTERRLSEFVRSTKIAKGDPRDLAHNDLMRVIGMTSPLLKMTTIYPSDSESVVRKEIAFLNSDRAAMPNAVRMMRRATIVSSWAYVRDFFYGYHQSETVDMVCRSQLEGWKK